MAWHNMPTYAIFDATQTIGAFFPGRCVERLSNLQETCGLNRASVLVIVETGFFERQITEAEQSFCLASLIRENRFIGQLQDSIGKSQLPVIRQTPVVIVELAQTL